MSARQEKVREALALAWPDNHVEDDEFIAALAEVEEWEAERDVLRQGIADLEERRQREMIALAQRAEAAEAERDRLKAALVKLLDVDNWSDDFGTEEQAAARAALSPSEQSAT